MCAFYLACSVTVVVSVPSSKMKINSMSWTTIVVQSFKIIFGKKEFTLIRPYSDKELAYPFDQVLISSNIKFLLLETNKFCKNINRAPKQTNNEMEKKVW